MANAFRSDLQPFLAAFVEQHRGLRFGRLFGRPAGYAGRHAFAYLADDALIVKLPEGVAKDEVRGGKAALFAQRGRQSRSWIKYSPRNVRDAVRLAPILEVAARFAAQAA